MCIYTCVRGPSRGRGGGERGWLGAGPSSVAHIMHSSDDDGNDCKLMVANCYKPTRMGCIGREICYLPQHRPPALTRPRPARRALAGPFPRRDARWRLATPRLASSPRL
eukprot:5955969-Pyramimonas_sp.AAC.1